MPDVVFQPGVDSAFNSFLGGYVGLHFLQKMVFAQARETWALIAQTASRCAGA